MEELLKECLALVKVKGYLGILILQEGFNSPKYVIHVMDKSMKVVYKLSSYEVVMNPLDEGLNELRDKLRSDNA